MEVRSPDFILPHVSQTGTSRQLETPISTGLKKKPQEKLLQLTVQRRGSLARQNLFHNNCSILANLTEKTVAPPPPMLAKARGVPRIPLLPNRREAPQPSARMVTEGSHGEREFHPGRAVMNSPPPHTHTPMGSVVLYCFWSSLPTCV